MKISIVIKYYHSIINLKFPLILKAILFLYSFQYFLHHSYFMEWIILFAFFKVSLSCFILKGINGQLSVFIYVVGFHFSIRYVIHCEPFLVWGEYVGPWDVTKVEVDDLIKSIGNIFHIFGDFLSVRVCSRPAWGQFKVWNLNVNILLWVVTFMMEIKISNIR